MKGSTLPGKPEAEVTLRGTIAAQMMGRMLDGAPTQKNLDHAANNAVLAADTLIKRLEADAPIGGKWKWTRFVSNESINVTSPTGTQYYFKLSEIGSATVSNLLNDLMKALS